jgi:hypothetical protein
MAGLDPAIPFSDVSTSTTIQLLYRILFERLPGLMVAAVFFEPVPV